MKVFFSDTILCGIWVKFIEPRSSEAHCLRLAVNVLLKPENYPERIVGIIKKIFSTDACYLYLCCEKKSHRNILTRLKAPVRSIHQIIDKAMRLQVLFENGLKEDTRDLVLNNSSDVPMRYKFRCPRDCVVDITESVGTIPAKGDSSVTFKFVPKATPVEPRHNVQLKMVPLLHTPPDDQDPFVVFKDHVISDIVHIEFEEEMNKELMEQEFFSPVARPGRTSPKQEKRWWQKWSPDQQWLSIMPHNQTNPDLKNKYRQLIIPFEKNKI